MGAAAVAFAVEEQSAHVVQSGEEDAVAGKQRERRDLHCCQGWHYEGSSWSSFQWRIGYAAFGGLEVAEAVVDDAGGGLLLLLPLLLLLALRDQCW